MFFDAPVTHCHKYYNEENNVEKLFIYFICLFLATFSNNVNSDIIVNEYVTETQLSREDVIKIFLFYRKFWEKSGNKIIVVLPPANSMLFKKLTSEELQLGATTYYEKIRTSMIDGTASPVFVESENEVLIKVSNTPYSIGYYHGYFKINTGFGLRTIPVQ